MEEMDFFNPTSITFIIYILAMIGIGFAAWRYTNNLSDYILGGRSLGSFVTAMSAGASDMSGWLLMGLPGAMYLSGLSEAWIAIGLTLGAWFNWSIVAGRLRVYTELTNDSLTLPDYFSHRFEDKSRLLRIISAFIILIFFTIYCASGMVAGARLFEETFGFSYNVSLWAGAAATIIYVFIGGFLAVSWTDTVQATLMIFALLLAPIMVINAVGGFDTSIELIRNLDPKYMDLFSGTSIVGIISLLAWGLGYMGQPHILARFMAAENYSTLKKAKWIGMAWMILCLIGSLSIGFFGIAYFAQHPDLSGAVNANNEKIFISLTQILFNPWVAGILLSAILSAVMSTLSCQLLVCSSALTEDFYKTFFRPNASQKELVWFGRMMVLFIAIVAIVIAMDKESRVLSLVGYAWAGFGAAFGPVVLFSLLWSKMNRNGALAGMLVGAITVIVWRNYPLFGLYELVPGFVFACIAIIVGSKFGAPASNKMQADFSTMQAQIK
jgi:sodium/proline symporter